MRKIFETIYYKSPEDSICFGIIEEIIHNLNTEQCSYDLYILRDGRKIKSCDCLSEDNPEVREFIRKSNSCLWVARNWEGEINIFEKYPQLHNEKLIWLVKNDEKIITGFKIPSHLYSFLTYENSPQLLKLRDE